MLSVILLILKIIGIAILIILGILLFLLLVVLFVPIRYRVKVEHGDSFVLEGRLSWFLHLIRARISQTGSKRRIWIRIMGILIYDSLRPPKSKKLRNNRPKARNIRKDNISKTETETEDIISDKEKIITEETSKEELRTEKISKEETRTKEISNEDTRTSKGLASSDKEELSQEKTGKFKEVYRNIKYKIKSFFSGIIDRIKKFIQKLLNVKNKVGLILNFINDDINKRGFSFTYNTIKKLLKHILPRKLRSRLIFGTGDPCSTGQLLGVFGFLYGFYGDKLQITPDFENKVFKGNHYVKGRIRIWSLLIISIKLLLDKRFKDLKMNYQLLKEAL